MNIILLGHYDFPSNFALSELVQRLQHHRLRIFLSGNVASDAALAEELRELGRYDRSLCERLNHRVGIPRAVSRRLLSFKELAAQTGAAIEDLNQPNSDSGIGRLAAEKPDLVISVRYRRILKENALKLPRLGVINLHSGLLPGYKGVMATFWAMYNGADSIGSTLHFIDDGTIDTGRIVSIQSSKLHAQNSYLQNVLSLYPAGCKAVISAVEALERGESIAPVRQEAEGNYFTFPDADALRAFRSQGFRLYDGNEFEFAFDS